LQVSDQNQSFRTAWRRLVAEGGIVETTDGFMAAEHVAHPPLSAVAA
jgi:hypothetical protein